MKKSLALVLSLVLLCSASLALAETAAEPMTIEIAYEGEYVQLGDYSLMMYLPNTWSQVETEDAYLVFQNEDGSQLLYISEVEVSEDTFEDILAIFEADETITETMPLVVNEYQFILYENPSENYTGAYLVNEGGESTLDFAFTPADDDSYAMLALQMLASITTLAAE